MPTKITLTTILLSLACTTAIGCKSRACKHGRDAVVEMTRADIERAIADAPEDQKAFAKEFGDKQIAVYEDHFVSVCLESDNETIACVKKIDELLEASKAHSVKAGECFDAGGDGLDACLDKAGDELDERLGECGELMESLMAKVQDAAGKGS